MSFLPLADIYINPATLLIVGLCAGMLAGCFGSAANLMVVPLLNAFGIPLIYAGGTSIGQGFGSSSLYYLNGGRSPDSLRRVGLAVGIFGLPGVYAGRTLFIFLSDHRADIFITNFCYLTLLLAASYYIFRQWLSYTQLGYFEDNPLPPFGMRWRYPLAPPGAMGLDFITVGRVGAVGALLGLATGFLGLGATALATPLFMYVLGLPSAIAASTSLIAVIIINGGGLISYSLAGKVEPVSVLVMLSAAVAGNRIAALLPAEVKWGHFRLGFSLLLAITAGTIILNKLGIGQLAGKTTAVACFLLIGSMAVYALINLKTHHRSNPAKEEAVH